MPRSRTAVGELADHVAFGLPRLLVRVAMRARPQQHAVVMLRDEDDVPGAGPREQVGPLVRVPAPMAGQELGDELRRTDRSPYVAAWCRWTGLPSMASEFWYHSTYGDWANAAFRSLLGRELERRRSDRGERRDGRGGPVHEDAELGVVEPLGQRAVGHRRPLAGCP